MHPALALVLSLLVLGLGPALALLLERRRSLRGFLDGLVLCMVGGLCLLFLLPEAWTVLGAWAAPLAIVGFVVPWLSELSLHGHQRRVSRTFMAVALVGLLLHSGLDGAALALGEHHHRDGAAAAAEPGGAGPAHDHEHEAGGPPPEETRLEITLAILLHRLPVSLLIWAAVPPLLGRGWAFAGLGLLMAATVGGFALSAPLLALGSAGATATIEALLAGGLLHVVLDHGPGEARQPGAWQPASAIGAIAAAVLFATLPLRHVPGLHEASSAFLHLLYESSPAILLGFLGAGLLSLVPTTTLARLMTGRTALGSAVRGLVFGLPIPICSCGVVPIYRGLMRKGVPPAAAVAFLVATPELGVDAVLISIPLLGIELTLVRLVAAGIVALCAGAAAGFLAPRLDEASADGCSALDETPEGGPVRRALRYGFVESIDDLGPWILAGLLVAGFLHPLLTPGWLEPVPELLHVPLFTALAAPFYVCASAATPVAATFLVSGVSAGAVIAFLLTGPATNVTTYGAIRGAHGRGTTVLLLGTILGATLAIGFTLDLLPVGAVEPPAAGDHAPGPLAVAAAAAFGLLLLASLFRQGPRGFLAQLGLAHEHDHGPGGEPDHDHDHDHDHGDDHGDEPQPAVATAVRSCCDKPCG